MANGKVKIWQESLMKMDWAVNWALPVYKNAIWAFSGCDLFILLTPGILSGPDSRYDLFIIPE
jgi:hypothetical protein